MNDKSPDRGDQLGQLFRTQRSKRNWSQDDLAQRAGVSVDSVQRVESPKYRLPIRSSNSGHAISMLARTLDIDLCSAIVASFSVDEITRSAFAHCLADVSQALPHVLLSEHESLADHFDSLPSDPAELIAAAAMLNADAMTFLMKLERTFNRFELLVTNQPPFMLFADYEYVTTGSSAVELNVRDRTQYHQLIFDHISYMQSLVRDGHKHYRVVLHRDSLITFLNSRSASRAKSIISSMIEYLQFDGFDLVVLDLLDAPQEYEILSMTYPVTLTQASTCISVQHRRIGLGYTEQYVLAVNGALLDLVVEDYRTADALWRRGLQAAEAVKDVETQVLPQLSLKRKKVAAQMLLEALRLAHPNFRLDN